MILVTGITGLTGRFLFKIFEREDKVSKLRCFVRKTSDLSWISGAKPEFAYGDVNNVDDLVKALKGVSTVIHLYNIRHSPNIIEACKKVGVDRVVFVNTTGIYSKYQKYSELYQELEKKIINSGLKYTIIRPTMIYGNHLDKNIHKLVKLINQWSFFPVLGKGKSLMQPIYAGDLAEVIYASYKLDAIGKDYNVAGKEPLTYLEILREIADALAKKPIFINVPYGLALFFGRLGEIIPNGYVNLERVQRLSENKAFDYDKANKELGFSPRSFREGIENEIQEMRQKKII